ncbi:hypothetical protein Pla123a_27330 [Posidoniimonas polymericola]|uniref:Uncharacterized protein n=1 Tax=Posidoniimonas polymericola TaxID=2528002 RepID=A0A5C5YMG5_9BACT|nr:DUF6498-containing protein [Posidoniimonas polymericola]TWT75948.1 hypothetical protein Pla123a_27330 [Posidoniimonas polymericola]
MQWFGEMITRERLLQRRWSVASLLAANLLPLLGVVFFGWSTFEVVILYWFENVVIGVINVLKMITCAPDSYEESLARLTRGEDEVTAHLIKEQAKAISDSPWLNHGAKFFFVPFFIVHYGMFCLVHGVFVVVLLGGDKPLEGRMGPPSGWLSPGLLVAAAALAASHLVSFFRNYLAGGEYRRTILPELMAKPYPRIVVLHMAIVLGAFVTLMLNSPILLLVILVVGKTLLDLSLHLAEHREPDADSPGLGGPAAPTTVPVADGE